MQSFSEFLDARLGVPPWIAAVMGIALLTAVVNRIAQTLLRQALRVTERTETVWDDALLRSASRPVLAALWVIGVSFMLRVAQTQVSGVRFLEQALSVRDVGLVICVAWFALRFVRRVQENVAQTSATRPDRVDRTTVDALGKLSSLLVIVVTVLIVAQTLGFQITGLLALGGVGGLAVGLAAKDLLANFFGGLTIYLDRPFSVGEWIRSPDKSIEGTVEHISWRHTRVRGFNKNPIYVPNAVFTTIVVENPGRMTHRRIRETIGLRYDDFAVVAPVVADIRSMLRAHPGIDATQTLIVNFNLFGASSLDLMVYAFAKTVVWTEFHEIKEDVLLRIGEIILSHGAEIAFPTQTLHIAAGGDVAGEEVERSEVQGSEAVSTNSD